jgi:hypothetical protein
MSGKTGTDNLDGLNSVIHRLKSAAGNLREVAWDLDDAFLVDAAQELVQLCEDLGTRYQEYIEHSQDQP